MKTKSLSIRHNTDIHLIRKKLHYLKYKFYLKQKNVKIKLKPKILQTIIEMKHI